MIYDSWTKWRNYKRNKPLKVTNMATSKMKIKKVCEWCGTTFYAQKLTTRFCSHRCNNLAYRKSLQTSYSAWFCLPLSVVLFQPWFVRAKLMQVHRSGLAVQVFHVSQGRVSFDVTLLYPSSYFCLYLCSFGCINTIYFLPVSLIPHFLQTLQSIPSPWLAIKPCWGDRVDKQKHRC